MAATDDPRAANLWDIHDVSAYLKVPVNSLYKLTAKGAVFRIPHLRIAGRLRFRRSDIDAWLEVLTTSDVDRVKRIRERVKEIRHGNDSQAPTS